ncbi:MAG: polysaccharide deacetylase family protein, partial [Acetobacteraceae bacterium]|nr:polysaccharide deacetylase family protein [Acetobacteraceae bacterium]
PALARTFPPPPPPLGTPRGGAGRGRPGARATFFVIGRQAARYPDLVRLAAQRGHEIASHSFTHRLPRRLSDSELIWELEASAEVIRVCTARTPVLYRPPGGDWDERVLALAHQRGYDVILWTWSAYATQDWRATRPEAISSRVVQNARPGDIVLLHDGSGTGAVVKAVEQILERLGSQGYRFVTVSQLLELERGTAPAGPQPGL